MRNERDLLQLESIGRAGQDKSQWRDILAAICINQHEKEFASNVRQTTLEILYITNKIPFLDVYGAIYRSGWSHDQIFHKEIWLVT